MNWSDALVDQIADRVFARIQSHIATDNRVFSNKLTFDEQESAEILGIPRHVLKGCRERGEILPKKIGKKWHYSRQQLNEFASSVREVAQ
jgi:hypothetical protein